MEKEKVKVMSETALVMTEAGTGLASLPDFQGNEHASMDAFNELVQSSFLPRVQLCSGSSGVVTEGLAVVGNYAFVRGEKDCIDLGKEVNIIPLCWRFAAMHFGEKMEIAYDPKSAQFKKIQAIANSGEQDNRAAYGPQFLIWVPHLKEFATFFFGSKSARPEARKMEAQRSKATTMKAKLVTTPKNKWHVPVIIPCTSQLEIPSPEAIAPIVESFNNPSKVEAPVEEATTAEARG